MTHMQRIYHDDRRTQSQPAQFWVVGGEYTSTDFAELDGPAEAFGPYADYGEAYAEWERRSLETKSSAHTRYMIAGNFQR